MSGRAAAGVAQKRWPFRQFQQIHNNPVITSSSSTPSDVTIDIPLSDIPTDACTGDKKAYSAASGYQTSHGYAQAVGSEGQQPSVGRRRKAYDGNGNSGGGPGSASPHAMGAAGSSASHSSGAEAEDGKVNPMGRIYRAIWNFSIVTRYLIYVSPLAILLAVPIVIGATIARNVQIGGVQMYWFFTWIEASWLSLWVSKLVAHAFPYVFQFLCGIVSSGTRKYALILRALEIPLSLVGWAIVTLVTFLPIMTLNPEKKRANDTGIKPWESTVKNVLFALLLCTLIYLIEKTIVQLISISYHRQQFDMKIKETKRQVALLSHLYEASRRMFPEFCAEFRQDDAIIVDPLLGSAISPSHRRSTSAVPLQLIRNVGQNVTRIGDKVTAAFGNVAQEITGKQVFNPTAAHSIVVQALDRRRSTEALARRIWVSFVSEGNEALFLEDIVEVLGEARRAEAEEAFAFLDRDGNGDVSLDDMVLCVADLGRTRKSLSHSLHDVDQAIDALDSLLLVVAFVIAVLVFVSFVTNGFGTVIAAGATSMLSLSFIFSLTAQEVLSSCIFLFVKHPFDVGDRVEVTSKPFIVERISLLYTVFRSVTDHRVTQMPNNVLNTLAIDNFTRSNAMFEQLSLNVAFDTTFAEIESLRDEMARFVQDKDNRRDFFPDINFDLISIGDTMDRLVLQVDIRHKSNWSNETIRAMRRSKFMCALVLAVRKLPIRGPGTSAPAPPPPASPDPSTKGKDGATLHLTNPFETEELVDPLPPARKEIGRNGGAFTPSSTTTTAAAAAAAPYSATSAPPARDEIPAAHPSDAMALPSYATAAAVSIAPLSPSVVGQPPATNRRQPRSPQRRDGGVS